MAKYPIAKIDTITIVCGGGEINGSFFGTLRQMVDAYTKEGCDFSWCTTPEDKLIAIENFEDHQNQLINQRATIKAEEEFQNAQLTATSLASIAASMEYQNMLTLEDIEV